MSLSAPIIQEYPSGVYQTGTTSYDPNTILIQPYLAIKYFPFASSYLLTLELLLPPSGNTKNTTMLD